MHDSRALEGLSITCDVWIQAVTEFGLKQNNAASSNVAHTRLLVHTKRMTAIARRLMFAKGGNQNTRIGCQERVHECCMLSSTEASHTVSCEVAGL
jgi:hypothetical protein